MSKLTLEEAISHCLEVAEQNETQADKIGRQFIGSAMDKRATDCRECAAEHRQLAEWLTDYKELREKQKSAERQKAEYKRLLKAAVPIINNTFPETGSCWGCANYDEEKDECKGSAFEKCSEVCKWEYADEAFALIGEEGDTNG